MSQTRSFIVDAGSNYLRMMATIIGTVFLTRAMALRWGVDEFGRWSLITTIMSLTLLLDLGLGNVVLKATGNRQNDHASVILSSVLMALFGLSTVAALVLVLSLCWMMPAMGHTLIVAVILLSVRATVVSLPWTVCRSALYARGKMSVTNVTQSIGVLVYSAVACVALQHGASLAVIAAISLSATFVDSLLLYILLRRHLPDIKLLPRFDYQSLRPMLSLGGASFLVNIAGFILLKTDPIIVKTFLPFAQVAMYAVALRISENIYLLCKQLVNALTPYAIRAAATEDSTQRAWLFSKVSRYVLAMGTPIYICALVLGRTGIRLWLSQDYESSAEILNILLLAMILSIPQLVGSNLLTFSGKHRMTATFMTSAAFINVILSVIFVHVLGATGVAYGTLATTLLVDVAVVVPFACHSFGLSAPSFVLSILRAICIPAGLQATLLMLLKSAFPASTLLAVALQGLLACSTFGIFFILFGVESRERRAILRALLPKASPAPIVLSEAL